MVYYDVTIPKFFIPKDLRSIFAKLENIEADYKNRLDHKTEKLQIFLHLKLSSVPKDEK